MSKNKFKFIFISVLVTVLAVSGVVLADVVQNYYGDTTVMVGQGETEATVGAVNAVGGICSGSETAIQLCNVNIYELETQTDLTVGGNLSVTGSISGEDKTDTISATNVFATTTLTVSDSGTTFYISASGTTITLPAVASSNGVNFRFVVAGNMDTASTTITSAAGDDVEGSILVNGAIVDCDAADVITIGVGGENLGDFVEIMSDGTHWFPVSSGFKAAGQTTCSG